MGWSWTKALLFVGGAATAGLIGIAAKSPTVRKLAVGATAKVLDANDAIQAGTQSIMDEASDVRAEAERQRKIDAAVAQRVAEIEEGIRAEVEAEVDGKAPEEPKDEKKPAARTTRAKK